MHRRRSKLRIVRPAASGRSHSLRCCSSQITAGCDLSEPSLRLIEIPAWRLQSTLKRSARRVVGQSGLEPPTSRLSVVCSSQLSYWPISRRRKLHITRFGHKMSKAHSLRCVSSPNQIPHTSDLIWCLYTSLVEISGIEPLTSCLQGRRSPS